MIVLPLLVLRVVIHAKMGKPFLNVLVHFSSIYGRSGMGIGPGPGPQILSHRAVLDISSYQKTGTEKKSFSIILDG